MLGVAMVRSAGNVKEWVLLERTLFVRWVSPPTEPQQVAISMN